MNSYKIKTLLAVGISIPTAYLYGQNNRPNIIFILVDDLGWSDLGCYGSQYYETPNIDKIANEGIKFTSAYAMPTSSPSRASLMSGKNPVNTNVYTVEAYAKTPDEMKKYTTPKMDKYLSSSEYLMSEMIKDAGYINGHFGKWHLGDNESTYPLAQGFDVNIAGCEAGAPSSYFAPFKNIKNIQEVEDGTYITDVMMDGVMNFIGDNRSNPFFLYLPFYEVHVPLSAREEWLEKYRNKKGVDQQNIAEYGAMVSYMDSCVGEIVAKIEELGIDDNTLIIITSDNGGQIMVTDNAPLRGQKGNLYEGGIRVPLIVKWNSIKETGVENDTPISIIDHYPTIAQILGVKNTTQKLDGESFLPILMGEKEIDRTSLFWHLPCYNGRFGANASLFQPPCSVIRRGEWKLIHNLEDNSLELYNLTDDIGESNNLAESKKGITKRLLKELNSWRYSVNAPMLTEPNPKFDPLSRKPMSQTNIR